MELVMQVKNGRLIFELQPDEIGELIQMAFRYSSGAAQPQLGWKQAVCQEDPEISERKENVEEYSEMPAENEVQQEAQIQTSQLCELLEGKQKKEEKVYESGILDEGTGKVPENADNKLASNSGLQEQASGLPDWSSEDTPYQNPVRIRPPHNLKIYKGFLLIKCQSCGEMRSFCAKTPIHTYICNCGEETSLGELQEAYAKCKCGKKWRYLTNATDNIIESQCIECGMPLDMTYNYHKKQYVPL